MTVILTTSPCLFSKKDSCKASKDQQCLNRDHSRYNSFTCEHQKIAKVDHAAISLVISAASYGMFCFAVGL